MIVSHFNQWPTSYGSWTTTCPAKMYQLIISLMTLDLSTDSPCHKIIKSTLKPIELTFVAHQHHFAFIPPNSLGLHKSFALFEKKTSSVNDLHTKICCIDKQKLGNELDFNWNFV